MRTRTTKFLVPVVIVLSLVGSAVPASGAATFTVTNTDDSGDGSLRKAITDANGTVGADTIEFDIAGAGPHSIALASSLPTISDEVVIDGRTQTGWTSSPLIKIDGSAVPTGGSDFDSGLAFSGFGGTDTGADGSSVFGLSIGGFEQHGIFLYHADGMTISSTFIGIDPDGTTADGNGKRGITNFWSSGTLIGGFDDVDGNVVSANAVHGVEAVGDTSDDVLLLNNLIGTDATGMLDRGNGASGVSINEGNGIRIGTGDPGRGNLISGNGTNGVSVGGLTENAEVRGNLIGVASDESTPLANGGFGITDGGGFTSIGGAADERANTVWHNTLEGIKIEDGADTPFLSVNSLFGNGEDGSLELPDGFTPGPSVTKLIDTPGGVYVEGTLTGGLPNHGYELDLYSNDSCGNATSPNATFYEGTKGIDTDANGDAAFRVEFNTGLNLTDPLTFQATDADAYSQIGPCIPPDISPFGAETTGSGTSWSPASAQIPRGSGMIWKAAAVNAPHTATDATGMGLYDSGQMPNGGMYGYVFPGAGTFAFTCENHPGMNGSVKVPLTLAKQGKKFAVTWAAEAPEAGFAYDVQVKTPEKPFKTWQNDSILTTALYAPRDGKGKYTFRARMVDVIDAQMSGYSPLKTIKNT